MITIRTKRLVIRNFVFEDWVELQEIIIDKETSEFAVFDHQFPTSDIEVQEIAKWFSQGDNFLAVYLESDRRLIGFIALNGETAAEKDLGYCICTAYQRQGYASEACTAVIDYAFYTLGTGRLTSGTANVNHPSCNLLNKLGFKKTAEGIASFRKTPDGKPVEFVGSAFILVKEA
jgi:RimJ/RimL family protein N-acetyltransferase